MKRWKKPFALLLAIVLVVGVVNLPVKAAGESASTAIDVSFGIHGAHVGNEDLLLLTVEGMTVASSGEPIFTKVSSDAKITFNGTECTRSNQPRTISAGLYLAVDEVSNGTRTGGAQAGDIIGVSGVWQYTSDSKYYDFGDVYYTYNGSNWEEYVPVVTPTDVTFGIHGGHVGNKDLLLV